MGEAVLLDCDTGWIKVLWLRVIFQQIIIKWLVCVGLSCYVSLMRIYSLLTGRSCVVSYARLAKLLCLGPSLLKFLLSSGLRMGWCWQQSEGPGAVEILQACSWLSLLLTVISWLLNWNPFNRVKSCFLSLHSLRYHWSLLWAGSTLILHAL